MPTIIRNQDYWHPKILRNVERDKANIALLKGMGWKVIVVWECELKKSNLDARLDMLEKDILGLLGDQKENEYGAD